MRVPRQQRRRTTGILINAWVALVVVFLLFPIVVLVPVSFNTDSSLSFPTRGLSLRWYQNFLGDPQFMRAILLSTVVAVISGLASLVIGTATATYLARSKSRAVGMLNTVFLSPLVFPSVVLGVALLLTFTQLQLIRSVQGLVLAHTIVTVPYVIRTVAASFETIPRSIEEMAAVLGATPLRTFRWVSLPLLRPGLMAGGVFALIMSFDEFTVSLFLVGPGVVTLPVKLFQEIQFAIDPTLAAVSAMLIVISTICIIVTERLVGLDQLFGSNNQVTTRAE